jgi:hypothetical protein
MWGEKVVLRLLDKSNLQLDMTKLGFDPSPWLISNGPSINPGEWFWLRVHRFGQNNDFVFRAELAQSAGRQHQYR